MKFIKRKIIFQVRSCFFCIEKQPPKPPLWECSPRDTQVGDLEENMALLPNTDLQWPEEEPIQSWKMIFIHREMSGKETLLTSNNTAEKKLKNTRCSIHLLKYSLILIQNKQCQQKSCVLGYFWLQVTGYPTESGFLFSHNTKVDNSRFGQLNHLTRLELLVISTILFSVSSWSQDDCSSSKHHVPHNIIQMQEGQALAFSLENSHVLLGRKNLSPRSLSLTPHCPELGDRPYSVPRMDSTWNRLTHSRSSLNIC